MPSIFRTSLAPLFFAIGLSGLAPSANVAEDFAACRQFFTNGNPPAVLPQPTDRALCFDAFAVLHSGQNKTPVFVAEKLTRAAITEAGEKRTHKFFADVRLRSAERATLEEYKGNGLDRGHMVPTSIRGGNSDFAPTFLTESNAYSSAVDHPEDGLDLHTTSSLRPRPVVAASDLAPPTRALAETKRQSAFW